jgi:hypothetical protein
MEKIKFFDYELYKSTCEESIYRDPMLTEAVDNILTKNAADRIHEQQGNAISSVGSDFNILHLEQTYNLASWIISQILEIDEYKSKGSTTIDFIRHWANRIYEGCSGLCHTHTRNVDGVAIFYLDVPDGGSNLVIINNGEENSNYLNYDEKDRHHIGVESGTLLIHKPDVPHAVSIHKSKDPRTCLIFEFIIVES